MTRSRYASHALVVDTSDPAVPPSLFQDPEGPPASFYLRDLHGFDQVRSTVA